MVVLKERVTLAHPGAPHPDSFLLIACRRGWSLSAPPYRHPGYQVAHRVARLGVARWQQKYDVGDLLAGQELCVHHYATPISLPSGPPGYHPQGPGPPYQRSPILPGYRIEPQHAQTLPPIYTGPTTAGFVPTNLPSLAPPVNSNKRTASAGPLPGEPHKKQTKWTQEEDQLAIELRRSGMKWEDISKRLPGRSAISCRLRYQNYSEKRPDWDEEKKNKLARLYLRFRKETYDNIAREMQLPWRAVERMLWNMGHEEIASRGNHALFIMPEHSNRSPPSAAPSSHAGSSDQYAGGRMRRSSSASNRRRAASGSGLTAPPPQLPPVNESTASGAVRSDDSGEAWYGRSPPNRLPLEASDSVTPTQGRAASRGSRSSGGSQGSIIETKMEVTAAAK
ncbi:hypothetical protein K402DRAFT_400867 [Aulographum hederae CBS 113979]|uniref:Uncharacterized protein n=1 Tax=Aulographum hederae CBS 113979 TaxID=1176131 RepID=A0A6G1HCE5_9PEZI|nr:hypothetical protein K402DRAFT_400867 [Aulographum hederae CBS 113979]